MSKVTRHIKRAPEGVEVKQTPGFHVKSVDMGQRIVEGYASTWDTDEVGDVIMPGAFQKSLSERYPAGKIKLLRDHDQPIGVPLEMYEDDRGLYVKARVSETPLGDETLQLARDGVINAFSIGFSIPRGKSDYSEDMEIRYIRECKLYEFSLVTFPANEAAVLTAVKELATVSRNAGSLREIPEPDQAPDALKGDSPSEPRGETETETVDPRGGEDLRQSLEDLKDFARLRVY